MVSAGHIVASKYCLLYEIGRGGMGSVWLAEHLTLKTRVAVKLIDPGLAARPDALRRFEREARAAAALRSPHIVQIFDLGVEAGNPYIVMEYLAGETLGERLEREGPLRAAEVWTVMSQLGLAIKRAHMQGFVHRDLKPDNLFLTDDEAGLFVKVLDFGIAKLLREELTAGLTVLTEVGALIGTPHHMSPEQAEGRVVDARSDLWSMAVIAFQCVTGCLPFEGKSLPALLRAICYDPIVIPSRVTSVPPGFDAWFACAARRDRERRFQTVEELVTALEPVLQASEDSWSGPPSDTTVERWRPSDEPSTIETYPGRPRDRRAEPRVPSSIPVGIDGLRDLRHTALIYNVSRTGALLATRQRCESEQLLRLALHVTNAQRGVEIQARVTRVEPRKDDSIWRFDVGVEFEEPLTDELCLGIQRRG